MQTGFPLFPEQASTMAGKIDAVYFFVVGISVFFSVLIFTLVIYFAAKYRRHSQREKPEPVRADPRLEIFWTVVPLVLVMITFAWGTSLYIDLSEPPEESLEIRAVGRQWMWKLQHPDGSREINQLHVPVGTPVRVILASEDVVHSFYIPVFRIKSDVVPGRYTRIWFEATKEGEFHLFCAEYCGTLHSGMIGRVVAMKPADYQNWRSEQGAVEPLEVSGERIFQERGCARCHQQEDNPLGPSLHGLFGRQVKLQSGQTVRADDAYVRESILDPNAKIVAGYPPTMPAYQGQLSEEQLHEISAYLEGLGKPAGKRAKE